MRQRSADFFNALCISCFGPGDLACEHFSGGGTVLHMQSILIPTVSNMAVLSRPSTLETDVKGAH